MPSTEGASDQGVGARRAALQMLDAVLRRGQTLDAAGGAVRNLPAPDHGLAVAIAGEALRRLPDLDALIDSATRQRLPDDSKAPTMQRRKPMLRNMAAVRSLRIMSGCKARRWPSFRGSAAAAGGFRTWPRRFRRA